MKISLFICGLCSMICLSLFVCIWAKDDLKSLYSSPACVASTLCYPEILKPFDTDAKLSAKKETAFASILNQIDSSSCPADTSESEDSHLYLEDTFVVYFLLDPSFLGNFAANTEITLTHLRSITYVGSGPLSRVRQHLTSAKAQCPDSMTNNLHGRITPTTYFLCNSVFESSTSSSYDVVILPVIFVETIDAARTIETILINYLSNQLVNTFVPLEDSLSDVQRTFVANFVLQNFVSYLLQNDMLNDGVYKFDTFPFFPLHGTFSSGLYENTNDQKKLAIQDFSLCIFEMESFDTPNNQHVKAYKFVIRLPFQVARFNFDLNSEIKEGLFEIIKRIEPLFKTNDAAMLNCFQMEIAEMKKMEKLTSIKQFVETVYKLTIACSIYKTEGQSTDIDEKLNFALFRRFRSKFEFYLTQVFYVFPDSSYVDKNLEDASKLPKLQIDLDKKSILDFIDELDKALSDENALDVIGEKEEDDDDDD